MVQSTPKIASNWSKTASKWPKKAQNAHKRLTQAEIGSTWPKTRSNRGQIRPKKAKKWPKVASKWPKMAELLKNIQKFMDLMTIMRFFHFFCLAKAWVFHISHNCYRSCYWRHVAETIFFSTTIVAYWHLCKTD